MNTTQMLKDLDKHAREFNFPVLDNAYVEFAAARLTAFRSDKDWLLVFEVLGFSIREVAFVNTLYGFGSCVEVGGIPGEEIPLSSLPETPLFDAATSVCLADWARWSIKVNDDSERMSFSPTRAEYAEAGIIINRDSGPGTLREIELFRFLVHHLGEERLFLSDRVLLSHLSRCSDLSKFLQTTRWQHPDVANEETPSKSISIRSLVEALAKKDPSSFDQGQPNTHWKFWLQEI